MTTRIARTAITALTILVAGVAQASTEVQVTPAVVAPGSVATLTIVTDTDAVPTGVDHIEGAVVRSAGRSSQVYVVNGAISRQSTFTYAVVPQTTGTLTLGPFQVGPDTTSAVTLTADPSAAGNSQSQSQAQFPAQPSPQPASARRAFARLWLGNDSPYVGQSVPLTLSAYVLEGTGGSLEGSPQLNAGDFVVEGLQNEPSQSEVEVDGARYTRFTWTASLTPVRAGSYALDATLPVTLQWVEQTERRRPRSLLDSLFANDPFFGGSIFGSEPEVKSAHMDLRASQGEVRVLTPPAEGRPEDFGGAVGSFELAMGAVASDTTVGEPVELHWTVSGTGNLSGLKPAGLESGDGYTAYPPETTFTPAVRSGTKGTMRVTQLVVPRRAGSLQLPDVRFSYLDADTGHYVTLTQGVPPIRVGASLGGSSLSSAAQAATPASAAVDERPATPSSEPSATASGVLPATARHGVVWLGPLAWLAVFGTWLLGPRIRKLGGGAGFFIAARARRLRLRWQLRRRAASGDEEGFFTVGRQLVRETLGADADQNPSLPRGVRSFLDLADRAQFGQDHPDPDELTTIERQLIEELAVKEAA